MNHSTIPTPVRRHMGARIRDLRGSASQANIARRIGVTQASLSNYERGKRELPLGVALSLAHALDVPLSELLEGVQVNPATGITL